MNKDLKAKWLAALRSGDYIRTQYTFKRFDPDYGNCFCPIGVLQDILVKEGKGEWVLISRFQCFSFEAFNGDSFSNLIQLPIQQMINDLNDNQGLTFSQIAYYIEANL